jgi:D-aspartate ligase
MSAPAGAVPLRAEPGWPPVVVASVFQTGLNLMRDFEKKGVRAVGVDCLPEHEGFRSAYGSSHACPDPDQRPAEWVAFMKSLAGSLGARPVFIPASDQFVMALGRHADELRGHYIFPFESAAVQASLCTKEQQYDLAGRLGFPCPKTEYVRDAAALQEFTRTARFPCLLKPRHPGEWAGLPTGHPLLGHKLATAATPGELAAHYARVEPHRPEAIAQEIIAGPDANKYCYLSAYGSDGCIGSCIVREFRSYPVQFGSASVVEPVRDDEIEGICDRFLRGVGYRGICEIEVKRDERDGKIKLIEVNPRFSGTGDSAIYTGVDVGWLHYLDLIGCRLPPVRPTRFDFRHITLRRDFPALPFYLAGGLTSWRELLRSYRPPLEFFDFDLGDWRVTARTLKLACRNMAGSTWRILKSRFRRAEAPGPDHRSL